MTKIYIKSRDVLTTKPFFMGPIQLPYKIRSIILELDHIINK